MKRVGRWAIWLLIGLVGASVLFAGCASKVDIARSAEQELSALPCSPEPEYARAWLDARWEEAQAAARVQTSKPRPSVCFARYIVVVCVSDAGCRRVAGYYLARENRALIALAPGETEEERFACLVRHEFGHALLGPGHEKVDRVFPRCE